MAFKTVKRPVKGYKVFKLTKGKLDCRGHVFGTVNTVLKKEHKVTGDPKLCRNGFHYCRKLMDCFNYYSGVSTDLKSHAICEVEGHDLVTTDRGNKVATNNLKVIKVLSVSEVHAQMRKEMNPTGTKVVTKTVKDAVIKSYIPYNARRKYFVQVEGKECIVPKAYRFKENIGCTMDVTITITTKTTDNLTAVNRDLGPHLFNSTDSYTYKFH